MSEQESPEWQESRESLESAIAIIGMTGRFPGARSIEELWQNLQAGVESITFFSEEEMLAAGLDPSVVSDPRFVNARGVLDDIEQFDAAFFGYSPRDADILDPQQRLFLECAWEALERAGYDADAYAGRIGVYGGVSRSSYLLANLYANPQLPVPFQSMAVLLATDKDFLTTRVSYKLNLRGPSVNVNTACSTSLVAIHVACQSLLNGECDMALAGGSTVMAPHRMGYLYEEGGVASPDGHCRAFDAQAQGMVDGNGVGIVVLKRLEDALADGDMICALIRGAAINNDGSLKVGFTAPSVVGQAQVITEALSMAGVSAESISYVEAHGTATPLGDPIEIAALTQAFRASAQATGYCAIGSIKTNVGHMDAAAGVGGVLKTVLALQHRLLPPSLHFHEPNPAIDFANSPFYVNTQLAEWKTNGAPRRAGVSSFGIGGTNAHAILEEAPARAPSGASRPWQLLTLSAKTPTALETATTRLSEHLKSNPDASLADVAYTLQVGRKGFDHRRVLVCRDTKDAVTALDTLDPERLLSAKAEARRRPIVFMFPGGGAQYERMGAELYREEPVFREQIDRCVEILTPLLGLDLRTLLYHDAEASERSAHFDQPALALPALFATEYALAQLWMSWGIHPQAMIGHSLGEYVAACLAGVLTLDDALALVALRGSLFEDLPLGGMLSVSQSEEAVRTLLAGMSVDIAAINGPSLCVVSGAIATIEEAQRLLASQGVEARLLPIAVAAHSAVVEPILNEFSQFVAGISLQPPRIPYISNVTGDWIQPGEATDPGYWSRHLRQTVRFADGLDHALQDADSVLLEVGPGRTLCTFARQHPDRRPQQVILASMRHPQADESDEAFVLSALGRLWLSGLPINWRAFSANEQRQRTLLPTYPFERQRYWIDPPARGKRTPGPHIPAEAAWQDTREDAREGRVAQVAEVVASASLSLHPRPSLLNAYVAPRDPTQRQLASLWQDLFGIAQIGIHDNFFELGGHSLMATQLTSRLREVFAVNLPLRAVLETPTIARLAESLAAMSTSPQVERGATVSAPGSSLVAIQPEGSRRPFFCVHPVGGNVLCYADLARRLGADQPFYALEAPGLAGEREPFTNIEEMAAYYLAAIRTHTPHGPYVLGGWSFGGLVAFEMARQLHAQQERVALLALIDAAILDDDKQFIDDDAMMLTWFAHDLGGDGTQSPLVTYDSAQRWKPKERLLRLLKRAKAAQLLAATEDVSQLQQRFTVFQTHMKALLRYTPASYPGQVTLFRAEESAAHASDPTLGWGQIAQEGVKICPIPGNHYTIVGEPAVTILAEQLNAQLAELMVGRAR